MRCDGLLILHFEMSGCLAYCSNGIAIDILNGIQVAPVTYDHIRVVDA